MANDPNKEFTPNLYAKYPAFHHPQIMKACLSLDIKEFVCGWGAAFINIAVTYPVYKIIFRQMLTGIKTSSAINDIRQEGIVYLYRGIFPPLAQKTISLSLMFGVYDGVRRTLIERYNWQKYSAKIIGGLTAGTVEGILMPFERIQTLLADSTYHRSFQNTAQAFKFVWTHHGIGELYRGFVPILYRNGPSNALFFILREEAAERLPKHSNNVSQTVQEFFSGSLIGAFLSSLFYPLNVIKVQMQSTMGTPSISTWQSLVTIYKERGCRITNVYKGCSINCWRAFISWGIMNTAYEHIKKILNFYM